MVCESHETQSKVFSEDLTDFSQVLATPSQSRLNIDSDQVKNGLAQLALTVIKLLHELLERQAVRRMEAGYLTEDEIEQLGTTLMLQAQEIEKLRETFGLQPEDLNIDLGPLGKLL